MVAGATGNIGRAAAQALVEKGARVVHLGRDPDRLKSKADLIHAAVSIKGDKAMKNKIIGKRLWNELVQLTGLGIELDARRT